VSRFLSEGHKVKITIMFRGREMSHPELGKKILDQVAEQVGPLAKIEAAPKLDGRNMIMVLAPDRRAQQAATSRPSRGSGDSEADATPPSVAASPNGRRRTASETPTPTPANGVTNGGGSGSAGPAGAQREPPEPREPTDQPVPPVQPVRQEQ
jgi:translation initiation factor IF-3